MANTDSEPVSGLPTRGDGPSYGLRVPGRGPQDGLAALRRFSGFGMNLFRCDGGRFTEGVNLYGSPIGWWHG
jgi:hypothetical protein